MSASDAVNVNAWCVRWQGAADALALQKSRLGG